MAIAFQPLKSSHFPLLLRWLNAPHIKEWWDPEITHTIESTRAKYEPYTQGYKVADGIQKSIHAFIICVDQMPVGYIQIYNAYDFARSKPLIGLPEKLGAFDIFIGQKGYQEKNIGSQALIHFFTLYGKNYSHIFADPDIDNIAAIKRSISVTRINFLYITRAQLNQLAGDLCLT